MEKVSTKKPENPIYPKENETMMGTLHGSISQITEQYIRCLNKTDPPSACKIEADILEKITDEVIEHNELIASEGHADELMWEIPQKLNPAQIAAIMAHLYDIRLMSNPCIHNDKMPNKRKELFILVNRKDGWSRSREHISDIELFRIIAMQYDCTMTDEEFKTCMSVLRGIIYCKENVITFDKNLIYSR